jgi:hypothetical protein
MCVYMHVCVYVHLCMYVCMYVCMHVFSASEGHSDNLHGGSELLLSRKDSIHTYIRMYKTVACAH